MSLSENIMLTNGNRRVLAIASYNIRTEETVLKEIIQCVKLSHNNWLLIARLTFNFHKIPQWSPRARILSSALNAHVGREVGDIRVSATCVRD